MKCRNCSEPVSDNVHGLCTVCNHLVNKFNDTQDFDMQRSIASAFAERRERKVERLIFTRPMLEERIIAEKIKAKLDKLDNLDEAGELARIVGEPDDGVRGASASPWPALAVTAAVLFVLVTTISLLYRFWPE